tara:strand:+ start:358 stop:495 length:138 start_codon:yes stop_codon:yes gene_type:complete
MVLIQVQETKMGTGMRQALEMMKTEPETGWTMGTGELDGRLHILW